MSDLDDRDFETRGDDEPNLKFVPTADLIAQLATRTNELVMVIWQDAQGMKYGTPASPLWAENAARWARKKLRADIDAVADTHDTD